MVEQANRRAALLVDFDNCVRRGQQDLASQLRAWLTHTVGTIVSADAHLDHVLVRLYGGWMQGGVLSRAGSEVAGALPQADPFPSRRPDGRVMSGTVELALGLAESPGRVFDDTVRRKNSAPRLRRDREGLNGKCHDDTATCSIKMIARFTAATHRLCPTPSCGVTSGEAFLIQEQKMVDTMMTCDVLYLSQDPTLVATYVATDDTDLLPPLIAAATRRSGSATLISPHGFFSDAQIEFLQDSSVPVLHLSGES
jgi:hypothetical protein